jgi:excisionase family DNA binding protein
MERSMNDVVQTVTVEQAAKILGIGRHLAYEAVRTGKIPTLRFGRKIRIPRLAIERILSGETK